jgi:hypothetical protein
MGASPLPLLFNITVPTGCLVLHYSVTINRSSFIVDSGPVCLKEGCEFLWKRRLHGDLELDSMALECNTHKYQISTNATGCLNTASSGKPFNTGYFKKSFTTLKVYINLFRVHVQCFELS